MKIGPFQAVDVCDLGDQIIRFRPEKPRAPSQYQRFILGEYASLDQLDPASRDREAVARKVMDIETILDQAMRKHKATDEDGSVMSRRDFLQLQLDHVCRPDYVYTNDSAVVSVVVRSETRFEVVYHHSLLLFYQFTAEYAPHMKFIDPECFHVVATFDEAEAIARERLPAFENPTLRSENRTLRMAKGVERDELSLQHVGERMGSRGYSVSILIAAFRGGTFRVEMGGGPCSEEEPYRVLYQLRPDGFHVEACATCRHFRFSGLTRDMSAGSKGYCTHPSGKPRRSGPPTTFKFGHQFASVEDYCPEYSFTDVPTCAISIPVHAPTS